MNSKQHPLVVVYHLLDAENLASVRKLGLLSTRRLVEASGDANPQTLRRHRAKGERLASGAKIRDQRPMPPLALARALGSGLVPEDWYALLNAKVFFWLDVERLNRQRAACGSSPQVALVMDARRMLDDYKASAFVSPINTGNAMRAPARRNLTTFVPYERWRVDAWQHEVIEGQPARPRTHRPVELTIDEAIPNAMSYVLEVIPLPWGQKLMKDARAAAA
ncbi:hypothetical protein SRS16CHR_00101 [Variovorax sp. SRS16]|uniref:DUF7002 family protein n=1 Tax=Variovorax sp. SRS16 TaxID=282217 RepID=UPI0013176915|nr:hypothetical protein [Variovorax sp. SRS16]VTU12862.1 hypothetical protein SRS16CHR_00101 [Variovorax sp. SRS16]